MYLIKLSTSAKKDLKRLSNQVQDDIERIHAPKLAADPYSQGNRLKGSYRGFWKYAFTCNGVAYRIAYEIKDNELIIAVIMIGIRENFYKELKRRAR